MPDRPARLLLALAWLAAAPLAVAEAQTSPNDVMSHAEAEFDVGHGAAALALWKQALAGYRANADLPGQLEALSRIGATAELMHNPHDAAAALAEALEIAKRTGNSAAESELSAQLAVAASEAGDAPHAIAANRAVLEQAAASGKAETAAWAAARLGDALRDAGQRREAAVAFQRAAGFFHALNDRSNETVAFLQAGNAWRDAEQYVSAIDAYKRAIPLAQRTGNAGREASAELGLGQSYYLLGDYQNAAATLQTAIATAHKAGDRMTEEEALLGLGNGQYFQGQDEDAASSYEQALAMAREDKNTANEGLVLGNLAAVYARLGKPELALEYRRTDIALAHERNDRLSEAQALGNLGAELMQQGKFTDAIPPLQQSIALSSQIGYMRGLVIALRNLGAAQIRTKHPVEAEATLRRAIAVHQQLMEQTSGNDAFRVSLRDTQLEAYSSLQAALVAEGRPEAALEVSEAGRARALAELLAGRGKAATQAPSPTIAQIREIARARQATLVEFSSVQADDAIYAWVVSPNGSVTFRRNSVIGLQDPINGAMKALVRDARITLGATDPRGPPTLRRGVAGRDQMLGLFYRILIAPIADLLPPSPEEAVVLVPQGPLFTLPFAALPDAAGRPLIEAHALIVSPSIQTLGLLEGGHAPAGGGALVVGNPKMPSVRLNPSDSSPTQFTQLPATETEAQAVAALLGAKPLIGEAATRTAVLAEMPGARVIHLATHGIADDVRGTGIPGALVFAAGGASDGMLTTPDLAQLRLSADLVVLSACNTGLGNFSADGVIGLSRGFLAAGAQNVVVSLWYVPDQETADLMIAFYRSLTRTSNAAAALRDAMLQTKAAHSNPLAWAGFILVGTGDVALRS